MAYEKNHEGMVVGSYVSSKQETMKGPSYGYSDRQISTRNKERFSFGTLWLTSPETLDSVFLSATQLP